MTRLGNLAEPEETKSTQPTASSEVELKSFEQWDYKRLKRLEMQGIEAYQEMRKAKHMTPLAVLAFIHQLSPWNLKSTGMSVLDAYVKLSQQLPQTQKPPKGKQKNATEEEVQANE